MQMQDIARGGRDPIYRICRNSDAADLADGDCVVYDVTTTAGRDHGADVLKSTASGQLTAAGIVDGAIVAGDYGRVQTFGFHTNGKTTAAALAAGATFNSDAAGAVVAGATGDDPSARMGVCLKLGVANRAGLFIKCM